jgi:thioredoxin-like negative regulator of GroEL
LGPKLENLVSGSKGAVDLAIVDIDDHPSIADELQVSAIPSVFAYKGGKIVNSFVGNLPDAQVLFFVYLSNKNLASEVCGFLKISCLYKPTCVCYCYSP